MVFLYRKVIRNDTTINLRNNEMCFENKLEKKKPKVTVA